MHYKGKFSSLPPAFALFDPPEFGNLITPALWKPPFQGLQKSEYEILHQPISGRRVDSHGFVMFFNPKLP